MNCNAPCLPVGTLVEEKKRTQIVSLKKIAKWFLSYRIYGAENAARFK
ncbi:hypothetical protein [Flavobacterium sp.]